MAMRVLLMIGKRGLAIVRKRGLAVVRKRGLAIVRKRGLAIVLTMAVCLFLLSIAVNDSARKHSISELIGRGSSMRRHLITSEAQERWLAIAARFEQRLQRLKEACGHLNVSTSRALRHAANRFVFPTNTSPIVLYCPVPKTGTTFLRHTFAAANNQSKVVWTDRFHVRPVPDYGQAIMFFFTREPYSRLLSAYVDKLWSPNLLFWRLLGKDLVKMVRPNATVTSLECGHDVTFPEFIRYFIDSHTNDNRLNSHLVPTDTFCEVCTYAYDYIGKLETFREDAAFILSAINVTSAKNGSNDDDIIMDHVIQAYYTIHMDKRKCLTKHHLLLRVWRALQVRGLISMSIHFPFSSSVTRTLTKQDFTKAVYVAVKHTNRIFQDLDKQQSQSKASSKSRDSDSSQSGHALKARDEQKRMALASAYSLIPVQDKLRLVEFLRKEFELFGYEAKPDVVFSPSPSYSLNPSILELYDV